MSQFEATIISCHDARVDTLARIKARSVGADPVVLAALGVLAYAQLEGGVKDLAAAVIKHVNARKLTLREISPVLLNWRNQDAIKKLRALVDFEMIGAQVPFEVALKKRIKVAAINRKGELNQMGWAALKAVYNGLGLDYSFAERFASAIDDIMKTRNDAAHYGVLPQVAAEFLELQLRENVTVVERVLTDLSLRLLEYFRRGLHRRSAS